jgi:dihydropteroate synthase
MFDSPIPTLDCAGRLLKLDRTRICGVLNVTPDSFSDGGSFFDTDAAVAHGLRLVEEGADLLDVGGESTRPGAKPVTVDEEVRRVVPVIERLAAQVQVPISIDTSKAQVMRAAVAAGAGIINDVRALREADALDTAASLGTVVCLMHMQGEPASMQVAPHYDEVIAQVHRFLTDRLMACQFAGIDKRRIVIDPGFGFGKSLEHNLALLRALDRFTELGCPLMVGLSRKRMIGVLTGRELDQRVHGSVAAALIAAQRGAAIVRVHDVAPTRDALAIWEAVRAEPVSMARSPAADASRRAWLLDEE